MGLLKPGREDTESLEGFIRSKLTGSDFTVNAIRQTRSNEPGGLIVELFIPHVKNTTAAHSDGNTSEEKQR